MVAGDRQHISQMPFFDPTPQRRVVAVDLVARYPVRSGTGLKRTFDHAPSQFRLGGELGRLRNLRSAKASGVGHPILGKVKLTVDQRRSQAAGVAEKHAHLAVLDATGGTRVLALDPHRMHALLQKTRLVDDRHALLLVQRFQRIGAHLVPRTIRIPNRTVQQMLHPVRSRFAHPLRQLPAVLALATAQKTLKIRQAQGTRLRPRKQIRDPIVRTQQLPIPSKLPLRHLNRTENQTQS